MTSQICRTGLVSAALGIAGCASHGAAPMSTDAGAGVDAAPPAACTDGAVDIVVCDPLGTRSRRCTAGQWSDYSACDAPPFLIIPVPAPFDIVDDPARHKLYIASRDLDGLVLSYDLTTRRFDPPLLSGGAFTTVDLSPDGDHLVVSDAQIDADHSWIYRIDLATELTAGAVQKLTFARSPSETGTTAAVFTTSREALVVSDSERSVLEFLPLRRVDLTTGAVISTRGVTSGTTLAASADHAVIGFAAPGIVDGLLGRYDVADETFTISGTSAAATQLAVDRTGVQLAFAGRGAAVAVFDHALRMRAAIAGLPETSSAGVAYSATTDELYIAWSGPGASIDAWSSVTLDKLRDIVPATGRFPATLFRPGVLRASRDGRLLFAITAFGIEVYRTGS